MSRPREKIGDPKNSKWPINTGFPHNFARRLVIKVVVSQL